MSTSKPPKRGPNPDADADSQPESSPTLVVANGGENGVADGRPATSDDRPSWRRRFISELRREGNVTRACVVAGVSPTHAYRIRSKSDRFNRAWASAKSEARRRKLDTLERTLFSRAVRGTREPVVSGGKVVTWKRRFSDRCLALALRGEAPKKYAAKPTDPPTSVNVSIAFTADARAALLSSPAAMELACKLDAMLAQPPAIGQPAEGRSPAIEV